MRRRAFLQTAAGAILVAALPVARPSAGGVRATVLMSPSCGCCGAWVEHLQASGGFSSIERQLTDDVTPLKRQLGIPPALWSCHTALIAGYVVEGHVPAADIHRLLRERPRAVGLAVPGMPTGSPGMPGKREPYATVLFDERTSRVFQRH